MQLICYDKFMKISFIIPAYNEEKYIGSCIEAILKETRANNNLQTEIIVVNNASTDRTKEIAQKYQSVKVVDEPKKGLVFARQAGAKNASGNLFAHIDADCRIPLGWVGRVLNEFQKDPNLVALSGPYQFYDFSVIKNFLVKIFYLLQWSAYFLNRFIFKNGSIMQGGNFVVKKSAWDKIGAPSEAFIFYGEDTDLAMRLFKNGNVKFSLQIKSMSSGRRLAKEGLVRTAWRYFMNYLSVMFFKKPFTKHYNDIRPA